MITRSFKFNFLAAVGVLVIVLIANSPGLRGFPKIDGDKWQAVFIVNNQVYFGHLFPVSRDYVGMRNIFYLQAVQPLQQGAEVPPPTFSLVKLGSELHGPEDMMYLPKSAIIFWENLRDDSQVVNVINAFIASQAQ